MLEELRNLDYPGTAAGIQLFLRTIAVPGAKRKQDIAIEFSHTVGSYQINVASMVSFCCACGLVIEDEDGLLSVADGLRECIYNSSVLTHRIVSRIIKTLFDNEVINATMFSFDSIARLYRFHNEKFPLEYSTVRNILIELGFVNIEHQSRSIVFYTSPDYETIVAKYNKDSHKKMTLNQLQKQLERNALAGELAEQYVLQYEQSRLGHPLASKVRIISHIDVSAGYDIISFNSADSTEYDRYIEVKAVDANTSFFWSQNEYEIAKLKGRHYCLYLVSLNKISTPDYVPVILQNPAYAIMNDDDWYVETSSYHVTHLEF